MVYLHLFGTNLYSAYKDIFFIKKPLRLKSLLTYVPLDKLKVFEIICSYSDINEE
jgi:hypothetical protein